MNILFILPEYYPHSGGGISTYYLHYIKALKPYCGKIKIIVGSGYLQNNDAFTIDGVEIEYLRPALYTNYLYKFSKFDLLPAFKQSIAAAWAMFEQAKQGEGFDIIECTDFALGFVPWAINGNKPVVTRMHGSTGQITLHEQDLDDPLQNDLIRQTELLLLPHCDTLITHSTSNKLYWEALLSKSVVKISPVFNYSGGKKPVAYANRDPHGLVTARIQVWKGPIQLCEAVLLSADKNLPIKWYGRDTAYLNKISTSAYLKEKFPAVWGKKIIPQKAVDIVEVQRLQLNAKFGIVPSTWDMFNFTCLEFLAAGTPVICSDGAGVAELITHKKNGFKYAAVDVQALSGCLDEINQLSEEDYNNMVQAGIETINNELSAEKLIPINLSQYERALTNFKPKKSNGFLNHIYLPSERQHDIKETLDKQSVKILSKYLFNRIKNKYTGKK